MIFIYYQILHYITLNYITLYYIILPYVGMKLFNEKATNRTHHEIWAAPKKSESPRDDAAIVGVQRSTL
jgi:hypothetical protein